MSQNQQRQAYIHPRGKIVFRLLIAVAANINFLLPFAQAEKAIKSPDSAKVFSLDHKQFAFVRASEKTVSSGKGDVSADVIFLGSTGKAAAPLFKSGDSLKTKASIGEIPFGDIHDLCFSNDGKQLYFLNAAYAVSDAVLAVALNTNQIRFVIDGSTLECVRKGRWIGNIIVQRHKYHDADKGGAYEVNCIINPKGKELKQLNEVSY